MFFGQIFRVPKICLFFFVKICQNDRNFSFPPGLWKGIFKISTNGGCYVTWLPGSVTASWLPSKTPPRWSFRWKNPRDFGMQKSNQQPNGRKLQGGGCRFVQKKHVRKQTIRHRWDLNIGETRVWRLDSGPNLQAWSFYFISGSLFFLRGEGSLRCKEKHRKKNENPISDSRLFFLIHVDIRYPSAPTNWWWSDMISFWKNCPTGHQWPFKVGKQQQNTKSWSTKDHTQPLDSTVEMCPFFAV